MEANLPVRVISDLHLGHPASRVKNVRQIEPLLEDVRTVIFNGDTVELCFAEALPTALRYRDTLLALCDEKRVRPIFVNGNHDPGLCERDHYEVGSHRLLVTHGDALFPAITPWNRDGELLKRAHEEALRAAKAEGPLCLTRRLQAARKASALDRSLRRTKAPRSRRNWLHCLFQDTVNVQRSLAIFHSWAVAPARASLLADAFCPECRFIAIGHTHYPGAWKRGGRVVFNTGSYLPWPGRAVVEAREGEMLFRKVNTSGKYFLPGRVLRRFPANR